MSLYINIPPAGGWNLVSVLADATTIDITGLNGDSDLGYELDIRLLINNTGVIDVRPNGSSSNLTSGSSYSTGAAVVPFGGAANSQFAGSGGSGTVSGLMRVRAISGRFREFDFDGFDSSFNGGISARVQWQDASTNLTSIRLQAANATSILTGSTIRWRAV